ncbi:MAG: protein-L-isoaspartate(D-aspartate) O-methyltransferase [Nitrospirae bacterium]|nr:MAG: protein-L-isoaspartate(D-aspartate) O-methyltransferase [Nitrospirota bacterium]
MVEEQIISRGIKDERVIKAMEETPRHLFVSPDLADRAYEDYPLPIGHGQTISQPYIVAIMTELLRLKGDEKVLEIGTGSGYQAAILSKLAKEVYTIEIIKDLAESAKERLRLLGYKNVHVIWGDGYKGLIEYAPFDCIIVTAAPPKIPEALIKQLKVGGRMVIPVGTFYQELVLIEKDEKGIKKKSIIPVRFVPMVH